MTSETPRLRRVSSKIISTLYHVLLPSTLVSDEDDDTITTGLQLILARDQAEDQAEDKRIRMEVQGGITNEEQERQEEQEELRTRLHLSTSCKSCGECVQVMIPPWMSAAIDAGTTMNIGQQHQQQSYNPHRSFTAREERRSEFVEGVIAIAIAIKGSRIPHLLFTFFQSLLAILLYLNVRFELHQRAAVAAASLFEGMIEIEKEVGLFRGLGEGVSMIWEATVKGTIAFAKAEAPSNSSYANPCSSSSSSRYSQQQQQQKQQQQHQQSHHRTNSAASSGTSPPTTHKPLILPTLRRNSRSSNPTRSPPTSSIPFPSLNTATTTNTTSTSSTSAPVSPRAYGFNLDHHPHHSHSTGPTTTTSGMRNRSRSFNERDTRAAKNLREDEERRERERELERARERDRTYSWAGRVVGAAVGRIRG